MKDSKKDLTTVQLDKETDRRLEMVAIALNRSKRQQVTYWVNREYNELENLKLLPKTDQNSGVQ